MTIIQKMITVQSEMKKVILRALTSSESASIYWSRVQVDLRKLYSKAKRIFRDWSTTDFVDFFNSETRRQLKKINSLDMFRYKKIVPSTFLNKDITKQRIAALVAEVNSSYISNLNSGEKEMLRLVSLTQQINATEQVGDFIKQQQKMLAEKAIDGKFIKVNDRYYNLKSYTDMVVRTKLREASTISAIGVADAAGSDLVQVSSHNTLTPFDAQFEGKIYSLSGRDPDFPNATFLPPFHPNCLHNITVVFREILERRGIQKYIDFANGDSAEHPTFKNFIPVGEREFVA